MVSLDGLEKAVQKRLDDARELLCRLVSIPSPPGDEREAMLAVEQAFGQLAEVQRIELTDALREDEHYSDPVPDLRYADRFNLRVAMPGEGGGPALLCNTHVDAVPPAVGHDRPFDPQLRDGCVYGRGACDAKGQIATLYLAMAALQDLGVRPGGDWISHLVVEEEVGGNGTLAMVRHGETAGGCVVLEPTDRRILKRIRGAVWFKLTLRGTAGHSGAVGAQRSALKLAVRAIEVLEGYHRDLLAASHGDPLFDRHPNPMPLTVGRLQAGNWPAAAPSEAVVEGVLGLLPNKTAAEVMREMGDRLKDEGGRALAENFELRFTYRHDASVCPDDHRLIGCFDEAARAAGTEPVFDAMTASCDAWFYNNLLNIPTVVFGGGSLSVAHGNNEHMPLDELARAARMLACVGANFTREDKS